MNLYRFRDETDHMIAEVLSISEEEARDKVASTTTLKFYLIEEEQDVSIADYLPVIVTNTMLAF